MKPLFRIHSSLGACLLGALLLAGAAMAFPASAAFTTFDATQGGCQDSPNGIDCNNYDSKDDVYMSGGPTAGGLADGCYFFAVLAPGFQNGGFTDGSDGNLSDTTVGSTTGDNGSGDLVSNRTFHVSNKLINEYASSPTCGTTGTHAMGTSPNGKSIIRLSPYDNTPNPGGVYILAICQTGATSASQCKYDAFKAPPEACPPGSTDPACINPLPPGGTLDGMKYYDANINGQWDTSEPGIPNWPITISDGTTFNLTTDSNGLFSQTNAPNDAYFVFETPANSPWVQTGNTVDQTTGGNIVSLNNFVYSVFVLGADTGGLNFGNVCVLPTGGKTLGFWSNKNGQALISGADLTALSALHLRNANGTDFDPPTKSAYKSWLLNANATNMAYMLSAQLSALVLDVRHGLVNGSVVIFGDGRTVNQIIADADALLAADGLTPSGDPNRAPQEMIKTLIDSINNNNILAVPPSPSGCPTPSFPTPS